MGKRECVRVRAVLRWGRNGGVRAGQSLSTSWQHSCSEELGVVADCLWSLLEADAGRVL